MNERGGEALQVAARLRPPHELLVISPVRDEDARVREVAGGVGGIRLELHGTLVVGDRLEDAAGVLISSEGAREDAREGAQEDTQEGAGRVLGGCSEGAGRVLGGCSGWAQSMAVEIRSNPQEDPQEDPQEESDGDEMASMCPSDGDEAALRWR